MSAIFVTATGTEIGKTYVSCGLIRHLRARGHRADARKLVVTGFDPARADESDSGYLLAALGLPITPDEIARISPWRFAAPLSPDLAARREGRTLDFDALMKCSHDAVRAHAGTLVFEGIGGIMVPLDGSHTVLDWMTELNAPALVVAGSYLGSISHTLTCLDVLRRRALSIRAVIVNETPGSTVSVAETIQSVSQFAQEVPVLGLGRQPTFRSEDFERIAELLH